MKNAIVGFGANLGRPKNTFQSVCEWLQKNGLGPIRASKLYRTAPAGGPSDQPPYINGALSFPTDRPPSELLNLLLATERSLGRERREAWGPRVVDLDLLWIEDTIQNAPDLIVPHPRMHQRWFTLRPAADLVPSGMHPLLNRTFADLLARVERPDPKIAILTSDPHVAQGVQQRLKQSKPGFAGLHCPIPPAGLTFHRLGETVVGVSLPLPIDEDWDWAFILDHGNGRSAPTGEALLPAVDLAESKEKGSWSAIDVFLDSIAPGWPEAADENDVVGRHQ